MDREPEGFREFVAGRSPALLRTAWLLTGDAYLAEDLLQTALVRTWPHWDRVRGGSPDAYVRTTMVRLQARSWRRRWRRELPSADPGGVAQPGVLADPRDPLSAADSRDQLRRALLELPPKQRQVIVLRHYEDLTEQQVAAVMRCSVGTVKSQNAKGLAKLRRALGDVELEETR